MDPELESQTGAKFEEDLDAMLPKCDFIVINTPLTEKTKGMFNKEKIAKLKKGVMIVNNARGAIMDTQAVADVELRFDWKEDPDQDVLVFARRAVRDLKLPPAFITQISQSIQHQLNEFRALEGQDIYPGDKMVLIKLDLRVNHTLIKDQFLWDSNNFESDPEEFAKTLCKDMNIKDPEVGGFSRR